MEQIRQTKQAGISYKWWVVVAAFLTLAVFWGAHYSFAVFFKPISTDFGWTRATTSGAVSTWGVVHGLSAILMGYLADRFGARVVMILCTILSVLGFLLMSQLNTLWELYAFYGLLVGVGYGASTVIPGTAVTRWFSERRGLALGIAIAGTGIGEAIIPPLAGLSISAHGWRASYVFMAVAMLALLTPAALLMKRSPVEQRGMSAAKGMPAPPSGDGLKGIGGEATKAMSGLTLAQAIRTFSLWAVFMSIFLWGVGAQVAIIHLVNYATDIGIAETTAATIFTPMGIGGIIGRFAMGTSSDRIGARAALCICLAILALTVLSLPLVNSISMFFLAGAFLGFSYGGCVPQYPAIVDDIFGLRSHGANFGFVVFGATAGGAVGPFIGGWVYDVYGSYNLAFLAGAVSAVAAIVFTLLARKLRPD